MATYLTPKTDWEPNDYLTYADYNRIKNNLVYLNDLYNSMYPNPYSFNPGADMNKDEMFKASKWNMFEECVEHLQRSGAIYTFGEKSVYKDNGHLPNYMQLNRLERCIEAYANYDVSVTGVTVTPSVVGAKNSIAYLPASNVQQFIATVEPTQAFNKAVTWKSSDASIATVDANGKMSLTKKGGTVYISAITEDGGFSDTATVYSIIKVDNLSINGNIEVTENETLNITSMISYTPAEANFISYEYSSSNDSVFTVSSSGVITGVANGSATLTVTIVQGYPDDPSPYRTTITKTVSVLEQFVPVQSITINPASLTMEKNSSATLTAIISPANATQKGVTWTSNLPGVVYPYSSSNNTCTVKSKNSSNIVTITATSEDGIHTATCTVTVKTASTGTMINGNVIKLRLVQKTSSLIAVMPNYIIPVDLVDYTQKISYGNGGSYWTYQGSGPSNLRNSCIAFRDNILSNVLQNSLGYCTKWAIAAVASASSRSYNKQQTSVIVPSLTELGLSQKYDRNESYDTDYYGYPGMWAEYLDGINPITNQEVTNLELATRSSDTNRIYAIRYSNPSDPDSAEAVQYSPGANELQFFKPLIYLNNNIKFYLEPLYNGCHILDFNNSPNSVYLKDYDNSTLYGWFCDPPDEIRQQLGIL